MMVKVLLLEQWYNLSDPQMEEALGDRISFRRFVGLQGREAGRRPTSWGYYSTIVRILQWGGRASDSGVRPPMGTDGFVLACALLQRRVWLGVRRCPTCPPSNVFGYRGCPPVPPAGAAPLHPAWRDEEGAVVPPSPPSDAFGNRGTHHTPAEATPPAPCVGTEGGQGRFLTFPQVRRPLSNSGCSLRLVRQHGKEVHGTASRAVQATHCASRCGGSPGTAPTQWFRQRNQPTWSSSASCRPSA